MDYALLTQRLVADAIGNRLPGLNKKVTFHLWQSAGVYDADLDTTTPVVLDVVDVVVVAAKPTFDDVSKLNVSATSVKLLVPGTSLPREPQHDVDKVTINGDLWDVKKVVGVPGKSLYIVFCNEA